ncbi:MAG: HAMP domain-containing sensor histidine kinase [Rhodocyclaceae bacterium]
MREASAARGLLIALVAALMASAGLMLSLSLVSPLNIVWFLVLLGSLLWALWRVYQCMARPREEVAAAPEVKQDTGSQDALSFLSVVGHDLRQPLQALSLYSATLATHELQPNSRQLVAGMETAAETLSLQFEDVMAIAKLDSGRIAFDLKPVSLGALMTSTVAAWLGEAHTRSIHLRYVPTSIKVWADEAQLARVLDKLVSHALRMTEEGGVLIGCRRRGSQVWLEVRDTSGGVAPELQDLVFKPFSTYGQRLPDRALGLVLAQRIVKRLGGNLVHRSRDGRGSVYTMSFERYTAK